ncbi:hypothetical protein XENOCAPTIV_012213 [Xenoophorus captivus]|uniref:Uncharacterized protein n=1 Tax=Xenoophorus captivus TaxID=1517983 RepID=A0ABV0QIZ9_9TELE
MQQSANGKLQIRGHQRRSLGLPQGVQCRTVLPPVQSLFITSSIWVSVVKVFGQTMKDKLKLCRKNMNVEQERLCGTLGEEKVRATLSPEPHGEPVVGSQKAGETEADKVRSTPSAKKTGRSHHQSGFGLEVHLQRIRKETLTYENVQMFLNKSF